MLSQSQDKVQTVLGAVSPSELGIILTHEHFALDFEKFYFPPPTKLQNYFREQINLENLGYIRQYPYGSKYNINYHDDDAKQAVIEDAKLFKKFGGGTIVENTTHGLKRNLHLMYEIARDVGINVIAGTGHYVSLVQTNVDLNLTVEEMIQLYTKEIIDGVDVRIGENEIVNVKCGYIGEIGSAYPINDFEKRSIIATAEVQSQLKCGVSFHPGRDSSKAPFEIMRIYLEAGGAADKAVMSHLDRTIFNDDELLEFSDFGCYCQYDFFGLECSHFQMRADVDMPSDAQRIQKIKTLIDHGKVNRVLMSHDIHTKHRLAKFGGHGFSHIINNTIPKMLDRGISQDAIDQITKINPSDWLKFSF